MWGMNKTKQRQPKIGDLVEMRGHVCRIVAIRASGTIDIESTDSHHAWRISGLAFRTNAIAA